MRGFQVQLISNPWGKSSCGKEPSDLYKINNLNPLSYIMRNRLDVHLKTAVSSSMGGFLCLIQEEKNKKPKINPKQITTKPEA